MGGWTPFKRMEEQDDLELAATRLQASRPPTCVPWSVWQDLAATSVCRACLWLTCGFVPSCPRHVSGCPCHTQARARGLRSREKRGRRALAAATRGARRLSKPTIFNNIYDNNNLSDTASVDTFAAIMMRRTVAAFYTAALNYLMLLVI